MTRKTLVSEIKENGGHRAGIAGARDTMFRLYKKGREFVTGVIVYFLSCKCTRLLSQVLNTHCIVERKWRCACMCENTLTSWKFWKERARGNRVLTWGRFHHRWSLIGQHLFAADTHTGFSLKRILATHLLANWTVMWGSCYLGVSAMDDSLHSGRGRRPAWLSNRFRCQPWWQAGRQEEVRIAPRERVCTSFERETLLRLEVDERQGVVKETHGGF